MEGVRGGSNFKVEDGRDVTESGGRRIGIGVVGRARRLAGGAPHLLGVGVGAGDAEGESVTLGERSGEGEGR